MSRRTKKQKLKRELDSERILEKNQKGVYQDELFEAYPDEYND